MKTGTFGILVAVILAALSCNNTEQQVAVAASPNQSKPAAATNTPGEGIVGSWKLKLETSDDNENQVLDEAERKKGFKNNYSFVFKADGSCKIQQVYSGRYEVKNLNGKQLLYVYRARVVGEEDKDPAPDIYRVISLTKTEMVLLEQEGNLTFWIFERVG